MQLMKCIESECLEYAFTELFSTAWQILYSEGALELEEGGTVGMHKTGIDILIGLGNGIYWVSGYGDVTHSNKYIAIGCGREIAIGSLYTTENCHVAFTTTQRMNFAINACKKNVMACGGKTTIEFISKGGIYGRR